MDDSLHSSGEYSDFAGTMLFSYLFDNGRKSTQRQSIVVLSRDDRAAQFDDQTTCVFQLAPVGECFLLLLAQRGVAFVLAQLQMRTLRMIISGEGVLNK